MKRRLVIGVIGSGEGSPELCALAEEAGRLIARAGCVLVNGGLGGVMLSSAKGAAEADGLAIGLLPGDTPTGPRRPGGEANPYVAVAIPTGIGDMRNALIVRASDGLIAIGGGLGTLSEIALALKAGKTVVGLSTWDVSDEIIRAKTPQEAVEKLLDAIR